MFFPVDVAFDVIYGIMGGVCLELWCVHTFGWHSVL